MSLRRAASPLLFALALPVGCGGDSPDEPPEPAAATAADTDTARVAAPEIEVTAVDLPESFPADFPIAPASKVVSATTTEDEGGEYSEVAIASQGQPGDSYEWYRKALTDAGWQISSEGQTDETRTLHAVQGESYVDLTVMPHPGTPQGWVQVSASIWKSGT